MFITDDVIKLECTAGSYAYIIKSQEIIMIDTCMPGRADSIIKEMTDNGISPKSVSKILITHHDIDHIGNAALLSEKCGCEVLISETDLPYAQGRIKRDGIKKLLGVFMKASMPDSTGVLQGCKTGEIEIILTPGHTRGHVCYRYKNVFFAGDAFCTKNGKIYPPPQIMTYNMKMALESCKKLDMTGIDWICPAHGEPVSESEWNEFLKQYLSY